MDALSLQKGFSSQAFLAGLLLVLFIIGVYMLIKMLVNKILWKKLNNILEWYIELWFWQEGVDTPVPLINDPLQLRDLDEVYGDPFAWALLDFIIADDVELDKFLYICDYVDKYHDEYLKWRWEHPGEYTEFIAKLNSSEGEDEV